MTDALLSQINTTLIAIHALLKEQASHFNELDDCERCQHNRAMRKLQREALEGAVKHMREEHGPEEGWKAP